MNKLEGFYALKESNLPSVSWKQYNHNVILDDKILWTVRSAVSKGEDMNLPRKVGVTAAEAKAFADSLINELGNEDMVIYYPYFFAIKSGVVDVSFNRIVIETVKNDLWNLVTYNNRDLTIIIDSDKTSFYGEKDFLIEDEINELTKYANMVKRLYRDFIYIGKSVFLEWSYAQNTNIHGNPIGEKRLVFYEIRSV